MEEIRHGSRKYYKGRYLICFYDKTDEWLEYIFDNVKDILIFMNKPITRQNINLINTELYRALKSDTHFVRFLTKDVLCVHIIKTNKKEI